MNAQKFSDIKEFSLRGPVKKFVKTYYFSIKPSSEKFEIRDSSASYQSTYMFDKLGNLNRLELENRYETLYKKQVSTTVFKNSKKIKIVSNSYSDVSGKIKVASKVDTIIWMSAQRYSKSVITDTSKKSVTTLDEKFRIVKQENYQSDTVSHVKNIYTSKYLYDRNGRLEKLIFTSTETPWKESSDTFQYLTFDKMGNPTKYVIVGTDINGVDRVLGLFVCKLEYY